MLHPVLARKLQELELAASRLGITGLQFGVPEIKGKKHTPYTTGLAVVVSLREGYAEWVIFRVLDLLSVVGLENSDEGYTSFLHQDDMNAVVALRKNYKTNETFWKEVVDVTYLNKRAKSKAK